MLIWDADNFKPEDNHKTPFTCHARTFQCISMPFGLAKVPATFQRALYFILFRFNWKVCLIDLENVIIYSNSIDEHITHIDEILSALQEARVTLKISKCSLFSDQAEYLGYIIRPGPVEVSQVNTKSLRNTQPPTNKLFSF